MAADGYLCPAKGESDPALVGWSIFRLDAGAVPAAVVALNPRSKRIASFLGPAPQLNLVAARFFDINGPKATRDLSGANLALVPDGAACLIADVVGGEFGGLVVPAQGNRLIAVELFGHEFPPVIVRSAQVSDDVGMRSGDVLPLAGICAEVVKFAAVNETPLVLSSLSSCAI